MKMVLKKFASYLYDQKGTKRFQMDDWHKDPQSFHEAVVEYLMEEGKKLKRFLSLNN